MNNQKNCLYQLTGGSGLLGKAIQNNFAHFTISVPPVYCLDRSEKTWINLYHPSRGLIHLAAKVGGVKANSNYISDFFTENMLLNQKVLQYAFDNKIPKVISTMSTCVYPDEKYVQYPLTEDQLHNGPPHESNFGYAYAKRMLDVMSRAYRKQYGCNFITAIPNNLYGPNDKFDIENGHVIPSLIRKIWEAKLKGEAPILWGNGECLREFTYVDDIAKILILLMENYNEESPINIGNTEEISIKDLANMISKELEYDGKIIWDESKPSGQFRKPSSNKKFLDLNIWKKEQYTQLKTGIRKTCKWFKENYPNVRGVNK